MDLNIIHIQLTKRPRLWGIFKSSPLKILQGKSDPKNSTKDIFKERILTCALNCIEHPLLQAELGTCTVPTAFNILMQTPQTINEIENSEEQAHCTQPDDLIFEDLTEKALLTLKRNRAD